MFSFKVNYSNTKFIYSRYNMMLKNYRQIISRRLDATTYNVQVLFKLAKIPTLVEDLAKHLFVVEILLKSNYLLFRSFL